MTLEAGEDEARRARHQGPGLPRRRADHLVARGHQRAYETGRGSVRVRARWSVEKLARGQYRIAVYQLPPNTSAARVLAEIEEITNPKTRAGKKSLTHGPGEPQELRRSRCSKAPATIPTASIRCAWSSSRARAAWSPTS